MNCIINRYSVGADIIRPLTESGRHGVRPLHNKFRFIVSLLLKVGGFCEAKDGGLINKYISVSYADNN